MAYVDISGQEEANRQAGIQRGLAQLFQGAQTMREDEAKLKAADLERKKAEAGLVQEGLKEGIPIDYSRQTFRDIYGADPAPEKSFFQKAVTGLGQLFSPTEAQTQEITSPEQAPAEATGAKRISLPPGFQSRSQLTRQKLEREAGQAALPYSQTREAEEFTTKEEIKINTAERKLIEKAKEKYNITN